MQSLQLQISMTFRKTIECVFTLKLVCYMIIIYSQINRTDKHSQKLNHLASLTKCLSYCLQTNWLWVQILLLSLKLQTWRLLQGRSSLTFKQTVECGFTLKLVRDLIIKFKQMHHKHKKSQHSLIIWQV